MILSLLLFYCQLIPHYHGKTAIVAPITAVKPQFFPRYHGIYHDYRREIPHVTDPIRSME